MDSEGSSSGPPGSDNQDSNEPTAPGTVVSFKSTPPTLPHKLLPSSKGVANAKKRLRAFSIQKKSPITPVSLPKPSSSATGTTVLIGKLASVKPATPKVVEDETKKPPKPPKPGANRKNFQETYTEVRRRTLAEIEDMKRKMELVDLGIPLGLICPSATNDHMPTKAMPPIKTFLDASKVDEIIRDAKKARAEGKEFKFDYSKILPDFYNPFQRKTHDPEKDKEDAEKEQTPKVSHPPKLNRISVSRGRDIKRKSDRYENPRRLTDKYDRPRKDDRDRYRQRYSDKGREKVSKREYKESAKSGSSTEVGEQDLKETDVDLSDYLVCDSWSLDNDEKNASPQVDDKSKATPTKEKKPKDVKETPKDLDKEILEKEAHFKAVQNQTIIKIEKLKPVIDSFEYEIDPNDDDILEIFDGNSKQALTKGKTKKMFDDNQDTNTSDSLADDNFLESVINEIKQENMSDDDSQDKGLVEYDSPVIDFKCQGTPELDDSSRQRLSRASDYSDSYRSTDSGCKSTESGYRSTESGYRSTESGFRSTESGTSKSDKQKSSDKKKKKDRNRSSDRKKTENENEFRLSVEKDLDEALERKVSKSTMVSLEMWDFVLKICQPLLFRHDETKCYRQTRVQPCVWWATRPSACACVRGRDVVLRELRAQRMALVDRVYSTDQISDGPSPTKRGWYPSLQQSLSETVTVPSRDASRSSSRAEGALPQKDGAPPQKGDVDAAEGARPHAEGAEGARPRAEGPEGARPPDGARPRAEGTEGRQRRPKGADTPQHGDTQLLDREYQRFMEALEVAEAQVQSRSTTPVREDKEEKKKAEEKEKMKLSSEGWSQESEVEEEVVKKSKKQKGEEKPKSRKRRRSSSTLSSATDEDEVKRKKAKKKMSKKSKAKLAKRRRTEKKQMKKLREKQKKKKAKVVKIAEEGEVESPKKKLKDKKIKKKQLKLKKVQKKKKKAKSFSSSSSSSSSSDSDTKKKKKKNKKKKEEAFDVNILNNIKTEKLTDDEKCQNMIEDFSPRRQQERRQEIINVKELGVQIKQEIEEEETREEAVDDFDMNNEEIIDNSNVEKTELQEPQERLTPQRPEDNSQCSSQDSACSEKPQAFEKDESHLRPSSQNSNYSFNDVIASQTGHYNKEIETGVEENVEYEQENYEMYEQLAMAYQSDVASNAVPLPLAGGAQRIETVVRRRCGEIKCDWRPGAPAPPPAQPAPRPSRWGLKPGEVNIVLTGGSEHYSAPEPVYRIESIANRNDTSSCSYDEAYMDMYGAMDRLQYGDCFSGDQSQLQSQSQSPEQPQEKDRRSTLDYRIDQALRNTVLGEIAMEPENKDSEADKDREKGILITAAGGRGLKRVTFADGYKPGQDSDTEAPPAKKRGRARRTGCAWPCPATHLDHVPLWDALPPPPPPPGSPPPRAPPAPPPALLRRAPPPALLPRLRLPPHKYDPNLPMPAFMPPEPSPGLLLTDIAF